MLTLRQWGYDAVAVAGGEMKREHAERLGNLERPLVSTPSACAIWSARWSSSPTTTPPASREPNAGGRRSWQATGCRCSAYPSGWATGP